ncbi:GerW family sporulation protein [Suipraeoptans intestinalis]|uniref:Sporulation protein n=1 Tax=Suipraeoptans intestinalis TaxID=2606628 RepID=A0A6N7UQY0_9FIRM|nr:GerW family sporulation protein [Suipraeoptans intestinalis]MDD7770722.1 GerW family sporulation protein [Suipraeoptans intestinalis]MSR93003.1 sporulation protein [Suipraeoptans intestinalis]
MAEQNFKETVEALFQGVDSVVSSKTVVGEPVHIGDVIILPLVDVSFAIGAGSFQSGKNVEAGGRQGERKQKGAGGMGGKMTPSAVLVIQNGKTKLVNIKNQDTMTKILDMVPDLVDRFSPKKEGKMTEQKVADMLEKASEEE